MVKKNRIKSFVIIFCSCILISCSNARFVRVMHNELVYSFLNDNTVLYLAENSTYLGGGDWVYYHSEKLLKLDEMVNNTKFDPRERYFLITATYIISLENFVDSLSKKEAKKLIDLSEKELEKLSFVSDSILGLIKPNNQAAE